MQPSAATVFWIIGITLVPAVGWSFSVSYMLLILRRESGKLLHMHEHADEYGFGTVALRARQDAEREQMRKLVTDNTRAMREVAHYIRWMIEDRTGHKPPPPTPAVMESP